MRPWRVGVLDGAPRMRIDLSEQEDSYLVKADIPGVRKEDIDVRIDGNQVTLSAQKQIRKGRE
jgi:HSP20 family protein